MPLIQISSSNRSTGTDTNFIINSTVQLGSYRYVRLKQAIFPCTFYNITDGTTSAAKNNELSFTIATDPDDSGTYVPISIEIPMGNYDLTSIINEMTSLINAALSAASISATITITTTALSGKLTFTLSDNTLYIQVNPLLANEGANLLLGFSRFNATGFFQEAVTAPRVFNLSRYLTLYLITSMVAGRTYSTSLGTLAPILGSIPINGSFGSIISYDDKQSSYVDMIRNINQMDFRLISDLGEEVDLNGSVIDLILEVQ